MAEPAAAELPIGSRAEFDAALRQSLAWADARGARHLWLVDHDFADWPLDQADWLDALAGWVRQPQRRLTLLAKHFDEVPRCHPRFTQWRRSWAHAVEAYVPAEPRIEVPTLLVDDGPVLLEMLDGDRRRGRALRDAGAARRWRDEIDALLQRCEAAFAPTVLGI